MTDLVCIKDKQGFECPYLDNELIECEECPYFIPVEEIIRGDYEH